MIAPVYLLRRDDRRPLLEAIMREANVHRELDKRLGLTTDYNGPGYRAGRGEELTAEERDHVAVRHRQLCLTWIEVQR